MTSYDNKVFHEARDAVKVLYPRPLAYNNRAERRYDSISREKLAKRAFREKFWNLQYLRANTTGWNNKFINWRIDRLLKREKPGWGSVKS